MIHPHRSPRSLLAVAAALRAAGEQWADIAAKVGRAADSVRHWPRRYAEEWAAHYRAAETQLLADAGTEARQKLRVLMRSKSEQTQLGAARLMFQARVGERARELTAAVPSAIASEDRELADFIQHVKKLSEAELERLEEEMAEPAAEDDPPAVSALSDPLDSSPGEEAGWT